MINWTPTGCRFTQSNCSKKIWPLDGAITLLKMPFSRCRKKKILQKCSRQWAGMITVACVCLLEPISMCVCPQHDLRHASRCLLTLAPVISSVGCQGPIMTEIQEGPHTLASRLPHTHCNLGFGSWFFCNQAAHWAKLCYLSYRIYSRCSNAELTDVPRGMFSMRL